MNYIIEGNTVSYLDHYYFQKAQVMPEADAVTFRVISQWFAVDCRHVYFLYNVVEGADPASFVYVGGYNGQWAKDKTSAYYFVPTKAARQWIVLASTSLDSFQLVPDCRFAEYARDEESVFYKGKKIRGADAKSFHIMTADHLDDSSTAPSHHFGKDSGAIYYDGKPLKGVDYRRFRVISTSQTEYGTDGKTAYYHDWARTKMVTIPFESLPVSVQNRSSS